MYPTDPIPCLQNFVCHTWASEPGLMYVDSICGLVLLLEAVLLFVLLRGRPIRWFPVVPLALAVAAFVLAHRMWDLYEQHSAFAPFPPGWFDSIGNTGPYGHLSTALVWTTLLIPVAAAGLDLVKSKYY